MLKTIVVVSLIAAQPALPRQLVGPIDNDILATDVQEHSFRFFDVLMPKDLHSFEKISTYLTSELETYFDLFIFVNSAPIGGVPGFTPSQTARVIRRLPGALQVFQRSARGSISGVIGGEDLEQIPVSTGIDQNGGILTFSGIFKVNLSRTLKGGISDPEAPMSYISYLDLDYDLNGDNIADRPTGVALHGTPTFNHRYLGISRASHGCVRMLPDTAQALRQLILSPELRSPEVPRFDRLSPLPVLLRNEGKVLTEKGSKTLIIIFDGMEPKSLI